MRNTHGRRVNRAWKHQISEESYTLIFRSYRKATVKSESIQIYQG